MTTARHDETADDEAVPTLPEAIEAFFVARRPRKDSPHTSKAYATDLHGIGELLARATGAPLDELTVADLTVPRLRSAFAEYADGHAKASINRCWSTWNQLFTFLVAEGHRDGNPMPAIAKAKLPRRLPKPLSGEDTPEQLLQAAATGRRRARNPWPERDLAVLATLLLCGLRSAELLDLRVDSLAGRPGERRLHVLGKGGRARLRRWDVHLRARGPDAPTPGARSSAAAGIGHMDEQGHADVVESWLAQSSPTEVRSACFTQ